MVFVAKVLYTVLWPIEGVLDREDDMVEEFGDEDDIGWSISAV